MRITNKKAVIEIDAEDAKVLTQALMVYVRQESKCTCDDCTSIKGKIELNNRLQDLVYKIYEISKVSNFTTIDSGKLAKEIKSNIYPELLN